MDNSVKNSDAPEIRKKSRSLDLQSLYVEKSRVSKQRAEGRSLKRKRKLLAENEDFGSVQGKKRRKSRKEVSLSSFDSVRKKSRKSLNAVDEQKLSGLVLEPKDSTKQRSGQVTGDENSQNICTSIGISPNLADNVTPFPKGPRAFSRQKKFQSNRVSNQDRISRKVSADVHIVKLTGDSVTPIPSSEAKRKKVFDDFKENSSSKANSVQRFKSEDDASVKYNGDPVSKGVNRNRGKRRESEPQKGNREEGVESSVNFLKTFDDLQEDDEENLEENAARMLSSRFDPSCTIFSGSSTPSASHSIKGMLLSPSFHGNFGSPRANHSGGLESNSADAAGRVLRPRKQEKEKHHVRRRRHFYEIFTRDLDAYWVLDRRIKVFWPLDQSWYFGLVTGYDPQRKMHHVKYDDRDEEWIDLQNERFKLLLLPSEVPRTAASGKSGRGGKWIDEEKGYMGVEDDDCVGSYMDSEPIISWLARSTRRVKSSPLIIMKKQKTPGLSKHLASPMLSEDSISTMAHGCLVAGPSKTGVNDSSCNSEVPDRSPGGEMAEKSTVESTMSSEDGKLPFVYFRKRFRKRGQALCCISENSECRAVIGSVNSLASVGDKVESLEEYDVAFQSSGLEDLLHLDWDNTFQSDKNLGLLKLIVPPMKLKQVKLKLRIPFQRAFSLTFGAENLWMYRAILLLQFGMVMAIWPKVQLEMLFVDNVVGLRFLLFEGCLMQAVAFICLVLVAFHQHNEYGEFVDQQFPVTSIRFELSGFKNLGRRLMFVFYNYLEVKNSKWLYLDGKLKPYCSVIKQLPLAECTYDNIKIVPSGSSQLPVPFACEEPASLEGLRKRSRQGIVRLGFSKESININTSLSPSNSQEKHRRLPLFVISFAAAPTFFRSLHLKMLLEKNVASISFHDPMSLQEGAEDSCKLMGGDCSLVEDLSKQITVENNMGCSLSQAGSVSELLYCADSKVEPDASISNDGWMKSSEKSQNNEANVTGTSVVTQDSGKKNSNDIVEVQCHPDHPSVPKDDSSLDKSETEYLSHLNGINVQIPPPNQVESQSFDRGSQSARQSTSNFVWNSNDDFTIRSPNPTARRSIWHRSRHSSGSLSFGDRSKLWPDGRGDLIRKDLVNGSRKPRNQVSYLLPFGAYDFSSKPRSHHRRGRPYKRIKNDGEKMMLGDSESLQRRPEFLFCDANVLITSSDRGWRECGAHVVLECVDHNDWRLLVKLSGATKYSYKAYQFLQPGSTNRYTHAMMWKGGKDWILEFPERSQWTLFKEMHEECYNRNIRASSVKTIPIPGVRLIEESDDNAIEVTFVRSSPKYFRQVETEVDMALNSSRVLYDMESDDEVWISERRNSSDTSGSNPMEISEEMFERTMHMFEKLAYAKQRDDFTSDEIEQLMVGVGPVDVIKAIHEHWQQKRRRKGMPLIRQFQPPLWEWYQKQVKEWELAMNKIHNFSNGCKEKAVPVEKPPMFAFCLRPRGLEVPNKGSKQRSQRKLTAGGHNYAFPRYRDDLHVFGRRSNGFACGEERAVTGQNHEPLYASPWQTSTRVLSPRDPVGIGYLSTSSNGSERNQRPKLHRNKSEKMGTLLSTGDSQMIATSYDQRTTGKRNGVYRWNIGLPEWPTQRQYQPDGLQRHRVEQLGGPELNEFRLRDASGAAQHASNMAKLKREKAERLLYRADLAIHKATIALMTAEAIKTSSEDSIEDG